MGWKFYGKEVERVKKLIVIGSFLVGSFLSYGKEISLNEAIELGKKENIIIKKRDLEFKILKLEKKRKLKAFLPNFDLTLDRNGKPYDDSLNPFNKRADTILEIYNPLFTGFRRLAEYKKAKIDVDLFRAKGYEDGSNVESIVTNQYFQVLNAQKQVEILEGVNETLEKQKSRLEKLYESNKLVRKSEVLKVKSAILSNEVELIRARQEKKSQENELKISLGIPQGEEIELKEVEFSPYEDNGTKDEEIEKALNDGQRLKVKDLIVKKAEQDVVIARSTYYPQIGIGFQKNLEVKQGQDSYRIGIGFRWNIFKWGSDMDYVEQMKYRLEIARMERGNNKEKIQAEIEEKYENLVAVEKQLEAQKLKVEIAEENLRVDTLRYNNSMLNSFEYLDSINLLRKSQNEFFILQNKLMLAKTEYINSLK